MLDVCGKDYLGYHSDWRLHDVCLAVLFFLINCDPLGEDHLLQEAIENESNRIHGENSESFERRRH